jgi:hypothetical protein
VLVERRRTSSESEEPAAAAAAHGDVAHAYGNGSHSDAHATLRVGQEGGNAAAGCAEGRSERVSALIQRALADDRSGRGVRMDILLSTTMQAAGMWPLQLGIR